MVDTIPTLKETLQSNVKEYQDKLWEQFLEEVPPELLRLSKQGKNGYPIELKYLHLLDKIRIWSEENKFRFDPVYHRICW
jgi:hypothetical protein